MSDQDVEAALLAAIYSDPDADEPRLVYMDWLIERGDPRGEFIALQMARHRSESGELRRKEARREAQLQEEHLDRWLGEVAPYVSRRYPGWPRFSRGFLDAVAIACPRPLAPALAEHPMFSTVTELSGECRAIIRPALRMLRRVLPVNANGGRPTVPMIPEWAELFIAHESIQEIRFHHSVLLRRDAQCVLRVNANYPFRPDNQDWLAVLARLERPGWTLELVSRTFDVQYRDQHRAVAAQFSERLPGFHHVFLIDEPDI